MANISTFYEDLGLPVDEGNKDGAIAMEWISRHYNVALMLTSHVFYGLLYDFAVYLGV